MNYPSGQYVTYEYDLLDRLVKEVYYNSDDSIQVEYQYIYSSDGQLAKQQAIRNGTVVESCRFEYDSLGRLIRAARGKIKNTGKEHTEPSPVFRICDGKQFDQIVEKIKHGKIIRITFYRHSRIIKSIGRGTKIEEIRFANPSDCDGHICFLF